MNRLTLQEQLEFEVKRAKKRRDPIAHAYYLEMLSKPNLAACVSFETFSKSNIYQAWMEKRSVSINAMLKLWQNPLAWI